MSKKRKSSDSYPSLAGIFTRSKSHTFFHHQNRSGRSRIDEKSINETLKKRARASQNDLSIRSTELSSVKDLRARRIFSAKESERFEELENEICVYEKKLISKGEVHAIISVADLHREEEPDRVQATPPDPEIVISRYENGTSSGKLEKDEALNDTSETNARSDAVKKLVPSPRRPVKIFKVSGSLSYRRLLPYLMEVAKESSNQVKNEEHMSDNDGGKSILKVEENQLTEDQEAGKPSNHGKDTGFVTDNLSEAKGNHNLTCVEKRADESVNVFEKVSDSNEQSTDILTPDTDTIGDEKENGDKGCSIEGVAKSSGLLNDKLTNESVEIVAKAKLGPKRCSRLKLFKVPGSFSYRRLLPYLCEINKYSSVNGDSLRVNESSTLSSTSGSDLNLENFRGQSNSSSSAPQGSLTLQEEAALFAPDHALNSDYQPNVKPLDNDDDRDAIQVANVHLEIENYSEADSAVLVPVNGTSQLEPLHTALCFESSVRNHADQSKAEENRSNHDGSAILNVTEISEKSIKLEENPLPEDQEAGEPSIHEKQTESVTYNSFESKGSNIVTYVERREGETDNVFEEDGDLKEQPTNMFAENGLDEKKENGVIVCSVEGAAKNSNQASGKLLDGSGRRNIRAENGKTTAKAKLRCSKVKLFKSPDSFNYRRLLPYLRMINKDSSGLSSKGNCPGVESLQENAQSSLSLISVSHDLSLESFQGHSSSISSKIEGSLSLQKEAPSNSEQPNTMTLDSFDKNLLQVVKIQSDIESHSETDSAALVSVVGTSQQEPLRAISPSRYTPSIGAVAAGASNGAKPVDAGALLSSSYGQLSNPSDFINNGPKRCILKRNPRGCRGLCLCLNCTSFRLHAERAFEFSKNQMQDAEEVALDLINELSSLRSLLQEFALQSDSCHMDMDMKQLKEACERASEAEELARTRINEMDYDLNVHCRVTCKYEPRVRFANNVQVRNIP